MLNTELWICSYQIRWIHIINLLNVYCGWHWSSLLSTLLQEYWSQVRMHSSGYVVIWYIHNWDHRRHRKYFSNRWEKKCCSVPSNNKKITEMIITSINRFGLRREGRFMASNLCPSEFRGKRQMKYSMLSKPLCNNCWTETQVSWKLMEKPFLSPNSWTLIMIVKKITFKPDTFTLCTKVYFYSISKGKLGIFLYSQWPGIILFCHKLHVSQCSWNPTGD